MFLGFLILDLYIKIIHIFYDILQKIVLFDNLVNFYSFFFFFVTFNMRIRACVLRDSRIQNGGHSVLHVHSIVAALIAVQKSLNIRDEWHFVGP